MRLEIYGWYEAAEDELVDELDCSDERVSEYVRQAKTEQSEKVDYHERYCVCVDELFGEFHVWYVAVDATLEEVVDVGLFECGAERVFFHRIAAVDV